MNTQTGIYKNAEFAEKQASDVFPRGEFLEFDLGDRRHAESTFYNQSTPFQDWDVVTGKYRTLIMERHESLYSETDSEVLVFDYDSRQLVPEAPIFSKTQDPYYLGQFRDKNDEWWHVIGGVKITVGKDGKVASWQDEWHRYRHSITELGADPEPWLFGVPKWKDTRAVQLSHGILVTPRPQGAAFGGAGQIGVFETQCLDTLANDLLRYAAEQDPNTLIDGVVAEGHWGAANQLQPDRDGRTIHVFGHDATFDSTGLKNYESTYFRYDRVTKLAGQVIVIATADDFPYIEPKPGHELGKIFFPAGKLACNDGSGDCWLMGGVGDRKAGRLRIPDPTLVNN